jgi:hypothetical protein
MPRNGSGTQQTPNTFVDQTTITAGAHNANWADAASEITNSMALDGQSQMSGQLKISSGTVSAPGLVPGSDLDTGIYRIGGDNLGVACGGAKVLDIATTGLGVTGALSATSATLGGNPATAFPSGTAVLFVQTSAPTGWTKSATHNDKALRVVSGTASSGGSTAFSTVFAARTISASNLPDHNVTITDPGHTHSVKNNVTPYGAGAFSAVASIDSGGSTTSTAAAISNTTGITAAFGNTARGGAQSTIDFAVNYVDCIIATKD